MRSNIFRGVAGAAVLTAALLATSPSAAAAPVLHPTPSGAVTDGQTVTVALDGLPANLPTVAIGQCKPTITTPADCNLGGSLLGTADAAGTWQPGDRGSVITIVSKIGDVDCTAAPGACTLAVTSLTNPSAILAAVPLTFATPKATTTVETTTAVSDSDDSNTVPILVVVGVIVVLLAIAVAVLLRRRTGTR
ncbi:neocarzinostatin apoprotein domain-containing protein [Nocardia sp. NBC_01503]|uniref:neocarzinostatin apoprotein domain-containing protein n=1 Tax=Nocardia sp. NBC_01503 TaxID=2975997 RepID=UPI002E7BD8BF|nr:neocarzinostatin apoprotein domain-containing protein [Nocardia sp. NBC_01503]WTL30895.1 neocarzinostatin apoprotein domain-containing protein [Nocardia sp. NBC_01503]